MALVDLLYRCPGCGAQPLRGEARRAGCEACGRVYEHVAGVERVAVREEDGEIHEIPIPELLAAYPRPEADAVDSGGLEVSPGGVEEVAARARFADAEKPIRYRRALLGFVEQFGPPRRGRLRLDATTLRFREDRGDTHVWLLQDIRAVQTASSALQISPLAGGVVSFRFEADSPRRWEELLKLRLRDAWRADGRGEIIEFQPRIRSR